MMKSVLVEAARNYSTEDLAKAWGVDTRGVYDRMEGYKEWSVQDAAAIALLCRRPLSVLV